MKRMFTLNSKSRSRWMLLLLFLLAGVTDTLAQNVTIKATNGSLIASMAKAGREDLGYKSGGNATWQHEQLSMVLTTSDHTDITANGQLDNPANNIYAADGKIQIVKGAGQGYVSLSLPKGFRFTKYEITFSKPGELTKGEGEGNTVTFNEADASSTFGETVSPEGRYLTSATIKRGESATITRTEMNEGEMSNVLYFRLGPSNENFDLITLESAEFWFTSEENYSPVVPTGDFTNRSAVDIPFSTSKVDYGRIQQTTYYNNSRISYTSANVKDIDAYFTLYEDESVTDGTNFDGTAGKVVEYKEGTISSAGNYFKLGKKDAEQVYFIETPTYVQLPSNSEVKNPVGYRIVEAKFDYGTQAGSDRTFYIMYEEDGFFGDTYYLYTNGSSVSWETRRNRRTVWSMDADGYIKSNNGYYLVFYQTRLAVQSTKPAESERFAIGEDGIYQINWPDYYIRYYNGNALISKDYGYNATYQEINPQVDGISNYKLKIYDKEGKNPHEITVTGTGSYTLKNLNNDAVKFGVEGIGLVKATLTLQALDPFLDHMKVVCNDSEVEAIKLKQDFTASDFSVSGGEFFFHVPVRTKNVYITFEDLVSKYFDETYDGGKATSTSRINFVQSAHNQAFGTWESRNNNIYSNIAEAAADKENVKERLKVGVVGTEKFKFNNADEVGASGGTLTEYPFTFAKYAGTPNSGNFGTLEFNVTDQDQVKTRYVFTTDETRYNIAPTTAIQHRAYAFYEMIVHVQSATYVPNVEFKEIYKKTFYTDDNGDIQTHPMYAVEVTAPVEEGSDEQGYAATNDIFKIIDAAVKGSTATGTVTEKVKEKDEGTGEETEKEITIGTYSGKETALKSAKQILNLDFSQLAGVYEITTDDHQSMDDYSKTNAKNCLVFLPKGASAPNDNVAYMNESGTSFTAANNIVITDKQPFYSPYEIGVSSSNKVSYTRLITVDKYGKVQNASLILPFVMSVSSGKHTNVDGTEFTLHTMQGADALTLKDGSDYAYFPTLKDEISVTTANTPYLVNLAESFGGDDASFTVSQTGATIEATTGMDDYYTLAGTSSSGSVADGTVKGTYTFTPAGTYAGQKVPKTKNIFYFAKNEFVNSADYVAGSEIKALPFRAYYNITSKTGNAKLMKFGVIFDEGEGNEATGISNVNSNPDLMVVPGNGAITFTSTVEQNVRVNSVSGVLVENAKLQAGETRTISVPAGMYVINGVKIIVK